MVRPTFGNHVDALMEAIKKRDTKRPVSVFATPEQQVQARMEEQQRSVAPEDKQNYYQQREAIQADPLFSQKYKSRLVYNPDAVEPYKEQLRQTTAYGETATKAEQAKTLWHRLDAENKRNADLQNAKNQGISDASGISTNFSSGDYQLPLSKFTITARYGQTGPMWKTSHGGLDLAAPTGTPIRAVKPGVITKIENHPAFGNVVWVQHPDGLITRYGHMSKFGNEVIGQQIGLNDILGYVGQTGNASGPHLHLGFYNQQGGTMNPETYIGYLLKMAGY